MVLKYMYTETGNGVWKQSEGFKGSFRIRGHRADK